MGDSAHRERGAVAEVDPLARSDAVSETHTGNTHRKPYRNPQDRLPDRSDECGGGKGWLKDGVSGGLSGQ
ncbi:hypothetical protein GCM10023084_12550 [Streptomyces lacrimifluminis]|uniref:Uncharacterized protein n=1 Tax=Streptomyces lacrimifluminis TaxID=1500077 RepID=A0A917NQ98_9ACTN|nr:hypothetical protein GCM10012282_14160 [Streptomyces lacrimifluminis]